MKLLHVVILLSAALLLTIGSCKKQEASRYEAHGSAKVSLSFDKEVALLKEIVVKDPDNVNAWIKLGNVFMDTKRFKEAIDAYRNALRLAPGNLDVRVDMGTCYRNAGEPVKAVEEYKKAVKINPNHIYAHKNLGVVYAYNLHKKDEAIKEFETYLKLSPNAPDALQVSRLVNELKK